ncbi:MAG: erythromycin esterase family protein [Lachnospiraceae bacterium]|nr:erythromycin esterase family protein [Lachnospiraceae bacterium]
MDGFKKKLIAIALMLLVFAGISTVAKFKIIDGTDDKIKGIDEIGTAVSEMEIPDYVKVLGVGEATHGNVEFQELKLEVLKNISEKDVCKSLLFEMPAGAGALMNDYVHERGEYREAVDIVGELSYALYDTDEMIALLDWAKDYNKGKAYEDTIMFYGIDMQDAPADVKYLLTCIDKAGSRISDADRERLEKIVSYEVDLDPSSDKAFLEGLKADFERLPEEEKTDALYILKVALQTFDRPSFDDDADAYSDYRDDCMLENTRYLSNLEAERGYETVMLTAHNGHLMKGDSESFGSITFGEKLFREYGKEYYVIGTDFYNATVNIHTAGTYDEKYERANHDFCSSDPLANQAKYFDDGVYLLDFSKVTENSGKIYELIHKPTFMGLVGEGFNEYSYFCKYYRTKVIQADRYDAVVYYYNANPIEPIHF